MLSPTNIRFEVRGVESVEDITFFGITRLLWLKQYPFLPGGIPGADTILRVPARISHTMFEEYPVKCTGGYFREHRTPGSVSAVDGKTVRGSADGDKKGIHLVSARAEEPGIVLGQVKPKRNQTG